MRCAAILAGGQSSRMGQNKALLQVNGEALIFRVSRIVSGVFERVVVVTSDEETARAAQLPTIADAFSSRGPLAGVHAALSHFGERTFCVACDMPFLNAEFLAWMRDNAPECDVFAPRANDAFEPLHAIYAPSCLERFGEELSRERPAGMQKLLAQLDTRELPETVARRFDASLRMFANWNTPDDVTS